MPAALPYTLNLILGTLLPPYLPKGSLSSLSLAHSSFALCMQPFLFADLNLVSSSLDGASSLFRSTLVHLHGLPKSGPEKVSGLVRRVVVVLGVPNRSSAGLEGGEVEELDDEVVQWGDGGWERSDTWEKVREENGRRLMLTLAKLIASFPNLTDLSLTSHPHLLIHPDPRPDPILLSLTRFSPHLSFDLVPSSSIIRTPVLSLAPLFPLPYPQHTKHTFIHPLTPSFPLLRSLVLDGFAIPQSNLNCLIESSHSLPELRELTLKSRVPGCNTPPFVTRSFVSTSTKTADPPVYSAFPLSLTTPLVFSRTLESFTGQIHHLVPLLSSPLPPSLASLSIDLLAQPLALLLDALELLPERAGSHGVRELKVLGIGSVGRTDPASLEAEASEEEETKMIGRIGYALALKGSLERLTLGFIQEELVQEEERKFSRFLTSSLPELSSLPCLQHLSFFTPQRPQPAPIPRVRSRSAPLPSHPSYPPSPPSIPTSLNPSPSLPLIMEQTIDPTLLLPPSPIGLPLIALSQALPTLKTLSIDHITYRFKSPTASLPARASTPLVSPKLQQAKRIRIISGPLDASPSDIWQGESLYPDAASSSGAAGTSKREREK